MRPIFFAARLNQPFSVKFIVALSALNCWETLLVTEIATKFEIEVPGAAKGTLNCGQRSSNVLKFHIALSSMNSQAASLSPVVFSGHGGHRREASRQITEPRINRPSPIATVIVARSMSRPIR